MASSLHIDEYLCRMKNEKIPRKKQNKVAKATRNAVINVADRVESLKNKAGRAWDQTEPHQLKIRNNLKETGRKVAAFGEGLTTGLKEGIAVVKKRKKKKSSTA